MTTMEDAAGPQAERSRRLAAQTARVFPPILPPSIPAPVAGRGSANEPNITSTTDLPDTKIATLPSIVCAPTAACHVQVAQLQDEKQFLTRYVERLLLQLRLLLQKHGELEKLKTVTDPSTVMETKEYDRDSDSMVDKRLPPWMVAQAVVHPLLQAYDVKIYELEAAVSESKQAMDRLARHAENLAQSNSSLRQELEATAEKFVLRMQHAPKESSMPSGFGDDLLGDSSADHLSDLSERIDVLMSENTMLMEQVSLQDDELGNVKKDLAEREAQIQTMGSNFAQATRALEELRDACTTIGDEKTRCEQQLQHYAARMAQLEGEKESLVKHTERLKSDAKAVESQLVEYELLIENVKKNAETRDESFATRYQNVCARLRELGSVVGERDKRIDDLDDRNRTLTSDLECMRQDCEGMLQVMDAMDKQLTQYCGREDAVAELEQDCKTKVEAMLLEKEQIAARDAQARREIARLLERVRSVTAEQLKTHEDQVAQLTRQFEQEIKTRDSEIRELSTELAHVRVKMDIAARNQREAEKLVSESARRSKEATDTYERKLKSLVDRASAAEEAKDLASRTETEAMLSVRAKEEELSKLRNDFRDRTQELNDRVVALERELEVRRTEARELREENEEQTRKTQLLNEQLHKVKADCATRFSSDLEAVHQQNRELKANAADLEYRLSVTRKELTSAVESQKHERERGEVRLLAEIETLKARLSSVKEEKARMDRARQEVESRHAVVALQLQQATRDLAETRDALVEREHACDDSDRRTAELSTQLTIALSKQQQFFRQERELRSAVERVTLEKTRLEREAANCRKKLDDVRGQGDYLHMTTRPLSKRTEKRGATTTPNQSDTVSS